MSRTLHHGRYKAKVRAFGESFRTNGYWNLDAPTPAKKKRNTVHCYAQWKDSDPVSIRVVRQKTRLLVAKVLRLVDLEDAPIFPHPVKPREWH